MVRFTLDSKSLNQLQAALKELPEELRRKPVEQAFVKSAKELRKEAVRLGDQYRITGSWSKGQQVVIGKYKQLGPYAVVRTANRKFNVIKRSAALTNPAPSIANPNKYNHLLQRGSKSGLRIGGLGKTVGTKRPRPLKFGQVGGRRLTGRGGFVVKNQRTGYLHRIAGIRHPGFKGHDIYGNVIQNKGDAAVAKFDTLFRPIFDKYKKKNGLA